MLSTCIPAIKPEVQEEFSLLLTFSSIICLYLLNCMEKLNVNQLIRSVVVLIVGLPIGLSLLAQSPKEKEVTALEGMRSELEVPCIKFAVTKPDSSTEREAKNEIDDLVGSGADYKTVCQWVLK